MTESRTAPRTDDPTHVNAPVQEIDAVHHCSAEPSPAARVAFPVIHPSDNRIITAFWVAAIVALAAWSAWHLGATRLSATVVTSSGQSVTVPNTPLDVDNPYHAERADLLIDSLRHGHILRWVGQHEGGYPVEFYPLGVPWLAAAFWAISLGTLSAGAAHKLVLIFCFLSPILAFIGLYRLARMSLGVAFLAFVLHLAVPGGSWSGGYTELIQWGLVTNVAAYVAAFGFMVALLAFLTRPHRWHLLLAVGLSSFAVATNTRSTVALGCAALGVIFSLLAEYGFGSRTVRLIVLRTCAVGIPAVMLSAPLLLSSIRYGDLYTFIRYSWYSNLGDYWSASVEAVSLPVMVLGIFGLVLSFVLPGRIVTRSVGLTLVFYFMATVILGGLGENGGVIRQLEATRLMPFQRLLVIFLAASAVGEVIVLARHLLRAETARFAVLAVLCVVLAISFVVRPVNSIAPDHRSMYPLSTTDVPQYADFITMVRRADSIAPPGTSIYIAGSDLGWHQPLWATSVTDRPLYYDNWLWLWQTWHQENGITYNGQAVAPESIPQTFRQPYLADKGVGAVITLTASDTRMAESSPALRMIASQGPYGLFLVTDPTLLVSGNGMAVTDVVFTNDRITASVSGNGGEVTIRETWFPRWKATVNGKEVPITRSADGTMTITVPAGTSQIRLDYTVNVVDWLGRALSLLAVIGIVVLTVWSRLWSRLALALGRPHEHHRLAAAVQDAST